MQIFFDQEEDYGSYLSRVSYAKMKRLLNYTCQFAFPAPFFAHLLTGIFPVFLSPQPPQTPSLFSFYMPPPLLLFAYKASDITKEHMIY